MTGGMCGGSVPAGRASGRRDRMRAEAELAAAVGEERARRIRELKDAVESSRHGHASAVKRVRDQDAKLKELETAAAQPGLAQVERILREAELEGASKRREVLARRARNAINAVCAHCCDLYRYLAETEDGSEDAEGIVACEMERCASYLCDFLYAWKHAETGNIPAYEFVAPEGSEWVYWAPYSVAYEKRAGNTGRGVRAGYLKFLQGLAGIEGSRLALDSSIVPQIIMGDPSPDCAFAEHAGRAGTEKRRKSALGEYDPEKGASFVTYLVDRVSYAQKTVLVRRAREEGWAFGTVFEKGGEDLPPSERERMRVSDLFVRACSNLGLDADASREGLGIMNWDALNREAARITGCAEWRFLASKREAAYMKSRVCRFEAGAWDCPGDEAQAWGFLDGATDDWKLVEPDDGANSHLARSEEDAESVPCGDEEEVRLQALISTVGYIRLKGAREESGLLTAALSGSGGEWGVRATDLNKGNWWRLFYTVDLVRSTHVDRFALGDGAGGGTVHFEFLEESGVARRSRVAIDAIGRLRGVAEADGTSEDVVAAFLVHIDLPLAGVVLEEALDSDAAWVFRAPVKEGWDAEDLQIDAELRRRTREIVLSRPGKIKGASQIQNYFNMYRSVRKAVLTPYLTSAPAADVVLQDHWDPH